jgi:hypothetical protein
LSGYQENLRVPQPSLLSAKGGLAEKRLAVIPSRDEGSAVAFVFVLTQFETKPRAPFIRSFIVDEWDSKALNPKVFLIPDP